MSDDCLHPCCLRQRQKHAPSSCHICDWCSRNLHSTPTQLSTRSLACLFVDPSTRAHLIRFPQRTARRLVCTCTHEFYHHHFGRFEFHMVREKCMFFTTSTTRPHPHTHSLAPPPLRPLLHHLSSSPPHLPLSPSFPPSPSLPPSLPPSFSLSPRTRHGENSATRMQPNPPENADGHCQTQRQKHVAAQDHLCPTQMMLGPILSSTLYLCNAKHNWPEYNAARNQFERIRVFLELSSRFEFVLRRRGKFF